jgi:hypothetical protein
VPFDVTRLTDRDKRKMRTMFARLHMAGEVEAKVESTQNSAMTARPARQT